MKVRVGVLFGGRSAEHEVSIISGIQAYHALNRAKYEPVAIYITKKNEWYVGEGINNIECYKDIPALLAKADRVLPVPVAGGVELLRYPLKKFGNNTVERFEVALPVVHGTNVEDGTLMGMLEMLSVPYVGCDVTASAVGMDKYIMKAVLAQAGLPVLPAAQFYGPAYAKNSQGVLEEIESRFGYPVMVKPVNLGSSIGIAKANNRDQLTAALDQAFGFAPRVLVERAVEHLREINCAVLGDDDKAIPSACERPVNSDEILSFKDKYLAGSKDGAKSAGMSSLKRICPADIPDEMTKQVQELAVKTFQALNCSGVARVDFLNNTETGELWVNEINTIPGSLAFYLWEAVGIPFHELLDRLMDLAFKRQRERAALSFDFESNILDGFGGVKGSKGKSE